MKPPVSTDNIPGIRFDEPAPPVVPDHELIRCVGRGAYGEVWLARNVMGTYRAVKVVYRRNFQDERPFEREYNGLKRFEPVSRSHESQIDILHIGRSADCFFYVMELADDEISGQEIDPDRYRPRTLHAVHEGRVQYTIDETLAIGLALTTALEHLHQNGLVHRDVKPSNVIFVNGQPKLADIGLVSSVDATRSFVGTEGFVPPEGPGAPTGDIYSLGKVLYELCTGRDRKDYPELPTAIAESPDRERLLELNAVIAKACRENPKDRYPTAEAMRQDLLLMQSGKSVRRMQKLERQLWFVRRAGAVVTALAFLVLAGWLYQARQTRIVEEMAAENFRLAEESQRYAEESQENAKESSENLVRLLVANGNRLVDEGDFGGSLPWFVAALKRVEGDTERERMHRIRLDSVIKQIPQIVQVLRHDAGVLWCQFSPDGLRIATASKDHTARVWDVMTGQAITPPLKHAHEVECAVFSPDGKLVATASLDKTARLWDAYTGDAASDPLPLQDVPELRSPLVAFSPDGTMLLTTQSRAGPKLWDVRTGKELVQGWSPNAYVPSARFSPDGQSIALGAQDGFVTVWDLRLGKAKFPPIKAGTSIRSLAFNLDGSRLLTCSGYDNSFWLRDRGMARVWSAQDGKPLTPEMMHDVAVIRGEFSPDATQVVTAQAGIGEVGIARIWNTETGRQIGRDIPQGSAIMTVAFSPDGSRIVACSQNATARLWATNGDPLSPPLRHGGWVHHAQISSDGQSLATACEDGLVRIWDLTSAGTPDQVFRGDLADERQRGHEGDLRDAQFSPDGEMVAGVFIKAGGEGAAYLWELESGATLVPKLNHTNGHVETLEFNRDGSRILLAPRFFAGRKATVWSGSTGQLMLELDHGSGIKRARFSPDSAHILTAGMDGMARVWDANSGAQVGAEMSHDQLILDGQFSPDGARVVTAGFDKRARVWDWRTGERLPFELPHGEALASARFSLDGRKIVTTSWDQRVRVWDAGTGTMLADHYHPGTGWGASLGPCGSRFASWAGAPFAYVWDLDTSQRVLPPLHHAGGLLDTDFSRDGQIIATASEDATARLWDAETGEPISVPLKHGSDVNRVRIHATQSLVLTASKDGAARIWRFLPSPWSLDDLGRLAELYAANEIGSTLDLSMLSGDRIAAAYNALASSFRHIERSVHRGSPAWHRLQSDEAELSFQWRLAIWHLTRLILHEPQNGRAYHRRGNALAELGRWHDAAKDFVRAAELGERSLHALVIASLKEGKMDAARRAAQELVADAVHDEDRVRVILMWVTVVPALLDDYGPLQGILEARSMDPGKSPRARLVSAANLTRFQFWQGHQDEAARLLDKSPLKELMVPGEAAKQDNFWIRAYSAELLARSGRLTEAESVLEATRKDWASYELTADAPNGANRAQWETRAAINILLDHTATMIERIKNDADIPTTSTDLKSHRPSSNLLSSTDDPVLAQ